MVTENSLHSDTAPPPLVTEFFLMPRAGLVMGSIGLIGSNVIAMAAAPEDHRVLTIVLVLVVTACVGALFAYFLRLRCRMEVPSPTRALRWSIRKDRHQLALRQISRVMTLPDKRSDDDAYHVVFELHNGQHVRLSDYSWSLQHATKLAGRVSEFLEAARAVTDGARAGQ